MTPDLPITPLNPGPPGRALRLRREPGRRSALVWTVRAGTILTLVDLDGAAAMDGAGVGGITVGGAVVTGPGAPCPRAPQGSGSRVGWPGVVRHEPLAGSSPGLRSAFWADVTADAQAGRPVVVVARTVAPATAEAQRTLVIRGGRVLARASRAELLARLDGQRVTARGTTLRGAQVLAVPGVRSVCPAGRTLHVTADPQVDVAAALRALDPHAQVCARALTLLDVFQGVYGQAAVPVEVCRG